MSPAKRLSRKRFRALCERCAMWTNASSNDMRTYRFVGATVRALRRGGCLRPASAANEVAARYARVANEHSQRRKARRAFPGLVLNGLRVARLEDRTGRGTDFVQAVPGHQPTFTPGGAR